MKLTYRPGIDGLRTVAMNVVILNKTQKSIVSYRSFKRGLVKV